MKILSNKKSDNNTSNKGSINTDNAIKEKQKEKDKVLVKSNFRH